MGPGEAITGVVAIVAVFGGFFGGIAYIVHRVLSHRREIKLAEIEAEVRLRGGSTAPASDELLRAVATELHTQRQMVEALSRRVAELDGRPTPEHATKATAPANLASPIAVEPLPADAPHTPPQPLRA